MQERIHTILNKYRSLSAPLKATIWFTFCSIVQRGVSLITVPIFTRLLTKEQYGVYSLYQSWYTILSVFATFNLYMGVANTGVVKYEKDSNGFISALQSLTTVIGLVAWGIYSLNTEFWNNITGLSTILMEVMFLEIFFSLGISFWSVKQRCRYKYRLLIVITLLIAILSPILGIWGVMQTSHKAEARIIAFVIVQGLFGGFLYFSNIRDGKKIIDMSYYKYSLTMGIPLILHYLSQSILSQSDRIMISRMAGNDKTAIYSVAYGVSSIMLIVTNAINNSFHPYEMKMIRDKKYSSLKQTTNFLVITVGFLCVFASLFGPEVITILGGSQYSQAKWVMPPVTLSVYFMFLYPLFGNIEMYYGKTKIVMFASLIAAALNIILNYIFIPIFGFVAAGYTTLLCYIVYSFVHYIAARHVMKKINENIKEVYNLEFIFAFSFFLLIIGVMVALIYTKVFIRIILVGFILGMGIINRKQLLKIIKEMRND